MSRLQRWWNFYFGPVDAIRLDTFRALTAACYLLYLLARWPYAGEWLTDTGFHVSMGMYRRQPMVLPLLPHAALPWFGALLLGSATALLVGWRVRAAAAVAFGCFLYATYADFLMIYTINKLFLVSLAVFALAPRGTYWRVGGRGAARHAAWPVRVLQATVVLLYFGAGWCKAVRGHWLSDPLVLWSQVQGCYRTDFAAWLLRILPIGVWSWMQYSALTFELAAPLLFGLRRLRPIAYLWGIGFQLLIALTMYELIYFSLQMIAYFVLFVEPSHLHAARRWPRRAGRRLAGRPAPLTS